MIDLTQDFESHIEVLELDKIELQEVLDKLLSGNSQLEFDEIEDYKLQLSEALQETNMYLDKLYIAQGMKSLGVR